VTVPAVTVKLTETVLLVLILAFDTVTVAVYDPTARLALGLTVNVPVLPAAMLVTDVADRSKLDAPDPLSATVSAPVAELPAGLVIVTVWAAGCV